MPRYLKDYNTWYIEFVGDGVSLYKSPVTNPSIDLDFDIDITGIKELVIKVIPETEDGGGFYAYGSNAYAYLALTGLDLYQ